MTNEQIVYHQLKVLGVPASLKGYEYIKIAVVLVLEDKTRMHAATRRLYPEIARACHSTASRVERAIRHAIEYVYSNTDPQVLFQYFGNITGSMSGKVTNTTFIAGIVEYINMEVKK